LRYDNLLATDASGRALHSWITLRREQALLHGDARGARYPLSIDPLIRQGGKLTGKEETGEGAFGSGVALSSEANTALIGGHGDNEIHGAAWAFVLPKVAEETSPATAINSSTSEQWVAYVEENWAEHVLGGKVATGSSPFAVTKPGSNTQYVFYVNSSNEIADWRRSHDG
jgi:hypothetical protein